MDCAGKPLDLSRPEVMGILNITPDSFSDGGDFFSTNRAVERGRAMVTEGAGIIDIGGESSRPGAEPVTEQEELDRVIPVIEQLAPVLEVPISIDTRKPAVMRAAVNAGAGMINDINALREPGAIEAAMETGVPVCLMHMRGTPQTMQDAPEYTDVVEEVGQFLQERILACLAGGISRDRLLLDPGFGFGKTVVHNLQLLNQLHKLAAFGYPLLVGFSRKSMIGAVMDLDIDNRAHPGIALAALAVWQGAHIVRSHDVRATWQAIRMCAAVRDVVDNRDGVKVQ